MNTKILSMSWLLLVAGFLNSSEQKQKFHDKHKQEFFNKYETNTSPKYVQRKNLHLILVALLEKEEEIKASKEIKAGEELIKKIEEEIPAYQ